MKWLKQFLRKWLEVPTPVLIPRPKPGVQILWISPQQSAVAQLADAFGEIERHDLRVESLWMSPELLVTLANVPHLLEDGHLWGSAIHAHDGLGGVVLVFPVLLPEKPDFRPVDQPSFVEGRL